MWSSCHLQLCRYLLLTVAVIGYVDIASAATIDSRSQHHNGAARKSSHSAREIHLTDRVHEHFRRHESISARGLLSGTGLIGNGDIKQRSVASSLPAFIPEGADLTPGLPQWVTNGRSTLGTKAAQPIRRQSGDSDSSTVVQTADGITRKYKFTVNYADIAPDGVLRSRAILINDSFPGPTIEANYGDTIEVEVTNMMTDDGTTMHWHGLLHKESQWMDGTPSIQQCPIAPGQTLTYRFKADQVGSSWYHSHSSAQYTSGAYGALIIHGAGENTNYDEDLGPTFLTDWYHETLAMSLDTTLTSADFQPPPADNLLINGKNSFPCEKTTLQCVPNAGVSKYFFSPGKKYRMRLINAGAAVNAKFSIDGHQMTVIAQDFTPVVPYQTDMVSLANGQRVDVVVEATGAAGTSYWMRFDIGAGTDANSCIKDNGATIRTAVAAIYYDGADENSVPATGSSIDPARLSSCSGEALNQLVPTQAISSDPQGTLQTFTLDVNFTKRIAANGRLENQWLINDVPYHADLSGALLSKAQQNSLNEQDYAKLYDVGSAGTVRVVMYDYFQFSHHPMHLHGHNFQVLAEGYGAWDGTITNPSNPMRRDVHVLNRALFQDGTIIPAYTVFQFFTDNPGVWPFHCHLAWHNSAGLFTNFMVRPSDIQKFQIPDSIAQTCSSWNSFTSVAGEGVSGIDSGV